jgi:hypothetical protein
MDKEEIIILKCFCEFGPFRSAAGDIGGRGSHVDVSVGSVCFLEHGGYELEVGNCWGEVGVSASEARKWDRVPPMLVKSFMEF